MDLFSDSDAPPIRVTVQASLLQPGREVQTDSFNEMPLPLVGANGFEFTSDPLDAGTVRVVGSDQAAG